MFHSRFVVSSILSIYLIGLLVTAASNGGFPVELIWRDSPKSPFYNAIQTHKECLDALSQRRMRKVHPNTLQYEVRAYGSDFVIKLFIGKPPVDIFVTIDTGKNCYFMCFPLIYILLTQTIDTSFIIYILISGTEGGGSPPPQFSKK
jgi:hypothetical protein